MCLAIPLKIVELAGKEALGEALGMRRKIRLDFIRDARIGEYVMVHAGFAIERLEESQALEDIGAWEEMGNAVE